MRVLARLKTSSLQEKCENVFFDPLVFYNISIFDLCFFVDICFANENLALTLGLSTIGTMTPIVGALNLDRNKKQIKQNETMPNNDRC